MLLKHDTHTLTLFFLLLVLAWIGQSSMAATQVWTTKQKLAKEAFIKAFSSHDQY